MTPDHVTVEWAECVGVGDWVCWLCLTLTDENNLVEHIAVSVRSE